MTRSAAPSANAWRSGALHAIIAASAALVGAGLGGLGTYEASRYSQDRQDRRAQDDALAVTRGTGRVLQRQFVTSRTVIQVMLNANRYGPFPELVPTFPLEDQKLLAARLTAEQWAAVAEADTGLRSLAPLLAVPRPPGTTIVPTIRTSMQKTEKAVDDAITSMAALTGLTG